MSKIVKPAPSLPDNYDPHEGLTTVSVAEALEKRFRRAKDATRLLEAVELKLAEQRKFVLWWDQQEKQQGARGIGKKVASQIPDATLASHGLDRDTVYRWRGRLLAPKAYDASLASAQARCVKVCEARSGHSDNARMTNTGEVEWYTPPDHLEAARDVLGAFDLDPASSEIAQRTVRAARYFTKANNGLEQVWHGRIWLNPPYQQPDITQFVGKLVESYLAGTVTAAIMLTNNSTDTAWFHQAAGASTAVCFTRGRIAFLTSAGDGGSPLQGQTFFYYGHSPETFHRRFEVIGCVMRPF